MMKIFGRIITTVSGQTIRDVMRYSRIKVGPDMMEFLSRNVLLFGLFADTSSFMIDYAIKTQRKEPSGALSCVFMA